MVEASHVIDPRGRAKVLRPLPAEEREAAVARGLAAYARGAFYLAHEELEPAWMAAADPGERELLGGLIKLAAAFVHAARGNPAGAATNLRGARERLAGAAAAGRDGGLDLPGLLEAIDDRLAQLAARPAPAAGTPRAPGTSTLPTTSPGRPVARAGRPSRSSRPPSLRRSPT